MTSLIDDPARGQAPPGDGQPMRLGRVAFPSDAWFDQADGPGCLLRISLADPPPLDFRRGFDVLVDLAVPHFMRFGFVATIKGRSIFEAKSVRPANAEDLSGSGRLLRLAGPFQKGHQDVA